MTSPDDLRTELKRVRGLTSYQEADRDMQGLMADVLITISESLAVLADSVTEPEPEPEPEAETPDTAETPAQQIHQQPAETPEAQMMDAVRPTEAGQTVVIEGGDGEMGTVTGFGSTEGRDYATVEWEHRGDLSVWVDILLVVALEADHGPNDDQFDLIVEDEDEAAARVAEQGDLDDVFAKELARRAKKAKKKGKGA